MPFIPHTPESLLQRSDSKNPASTCRGLTGNGRPCRRSLSKSPNFSPMSSPRRPSSPEAFCWQHRDQVTLVGAQPQGIQSATIKERTSVDTLVDRLGLLEVEERKKGRRARKPVPSPRFDGGDGRYDSNPQSLEKSESEQEKPSYSSDIPSRRERPRPRPQQNEVGLLCCFGAPDDTRRHPRPVAKPTEKRRTVSIPAPPPQMPSRTRSTTKPTRPSFNRDPSSRTGELLSFIPPTASPQTTALLLAELAKPVSDLDDAGYIYMFWLTLDSVPPPSDTASSLLAPPSRPEPGGRRTSDVLNAFATPRLAAGNKKTILLKIGRAQNVQRRLNQWTRQCGYDLSLIRYYPYHPTSSPNNSIPTTPRKIPCAHKVERLIHIELSGLKLQDGGKCHACGKEHREWFEVDASRNGVKGVDEVIRRWVDWGERHA